MNPQDQNFTNQTSGYPPPPDSTGSNPPSQPQPEGSTFNNPEAVEMARAKIAALQPNEPVNLPAHETSANPAVPPLEVPPNTPPAPYLNPEATQNFQLPAAEPALNPMPINPATPQPATETPEPAAAPLTPAVEYPPLPASPVAPSPVSLVTETADAVAPALEDNLPLTSAAISPAAEPVVEPPVYSAPPANTIASQPLAVHNNQFQNYQLSKPSGNTTASTSPAPLYEKQFSTFALPGSLTASELPAAPLEVVPVPPLAQATAPPAATPTVKEKLLSSLPRGNWFKRLKPVMSAAVAGILIFGLFNSQIILGQVQYLTNPNTNTSAPVINEASQETVVSAESKIIIPKINVDAPVVYDEPSFEEAKVQKALARGVVHYGTTALPGQNGNNVIVGHSSNNWWDSGEYKFAFVLLDKLEKGDTFDLHYKSKRYTYKVTGKKVVEPTDISVLASTNKPTVTLITCTPPGTSWHRLVVTAEQISPDPNLNEKAVERGISQPEAALPSDGSSVFSRLRTWIFGN